jgi:hypothetical protein
MARMIIANRLHDGAVVFLTAKEDWVRSINDGLILEDEAEQERWLATAKTHEASCRVIDPILIDVVVGENGPRPTSIREQIRAFGPTV